MSSQLYDFIALTTGLLLVWFQWFFLWQPYFIEYYRFRLFNLRDIWFEHAKSGKIDFSHPAYVSLRDMINAHIRMAHRFNTVAKILILYWTVGNVSVRNGSSFDPKTISKESLLLTEEIKLAVRNQSVLLVLKSSIILWPVWAIGFILAKVFRAKEKMKKAALNRFNFVATGFDRYSRIGA